MNDVVLIFQGLLNYICCQRLNNDLELIWTVIGRYSLCQVANRRAIESIADQSQRQQNGRQAENQAEQQQNKP